MSRPKVVVTVPRSVRLTEELDEYRKTLPHGEFSRIVNELLTKYVKGEINYCEGICGSINKYMKENGGDVI